MTGHQAGLDTPSIKAQRRTRRWRLSTSSTKRHASLSYSTVCAVTRDAHTTHNISIFTTTEPPRHLRGFRGFVRKERQFSTHKLCDRVLYPELRGHEKKTLLIIYSYIARTTLHFVRAPTWNTINSIHPWEHLFLFDTRGPSNNSGLLRVCAICVISLIAPLAASPTKAESVMRPFTSGNGSYILCQYPSDLVTWI